MTTSIPPISAAPSAAAAAAAPSAAAAAAAAAAEPVPAPTAAPVPTAPFSQIGTAGSLAPAPGTVQANLKTQEAQTKGVALLEKYQWIFSKYQKNPNGELFTKADRDRVGFFYYTLFKLVQEVDANWNDKTARTHGRMLKIDGLKFVMKIDEEPAGKSEKEQAAKKVEKLRLIRYSDWKKIEIGSLGYIKRVFLVCEAAYAVFKDIHYNYTVRKKDSAGKIHEELISITPEQYSFRAMLILKEWEILNKIHAAAVPLKHVQQKPLAFIDVQKSEPHPLKGILFRTEYKGNFLEIIGNRPFFNLSNLLQFCKVLSAGIEELWNQKCSPGDVKCDNVFIDKDNNVFFGDFDRAIIEDDVATLQMNDWGTQNYLSMQDKLDQEASVKGQDIRCQFQVAQRGDIFGLATIFYILLSNHRVTAYPHGGSVDGYFDKEGFRIAAYGTFQEEPIKHCPAPVIAMLRKMLDLDPKKRPSPKEVIAFWKTLDINAH